MLAMVRSTNEVRRTQGLEAAKTLLESDTGSGSKANSVESIAKEMSSVEQLLLQQRLEQLNKNTAKTEQHINFVNALFMISLVLSIWIYSASREKAQKSLALQHSISRLLCPSESRSGINLGAILVS
ncbi:hypothetical protein BH10CYA1_BH10CYA1_56720 [soil metagenome]